MKRRILAVLTACLLTLTGCAAVTRGTAEEDDIVAITTPYPDMKTGAASSPEELLADMSLPEKIGQMLMPDLRIYGEEQTPVQALNDVQRTAVSMNHFGGVILFNENFRDAQQAVRLIDDLQCTNARSGRTGLLIAADNEGGQITRLPMGTMLCGNMALGASGSETLTEQAAGLLSEELAALGIHVNFSPSLDVNNNPANPVIAVRSFSDDPQMVTKLGAAYVRGVQSKGVIPALKHFPGHGDTDTDSHTGLPRIDKSMAKLEECELIPFREAVGNGAEMLMTAHIQYPQIETDTYISRADGEEIFLPATLSDDILGGFLRERLGYDGIIITDAMNMDAIRSHFDPMDAARLAICAGADMLLIPMPTITDEDLYGAHDYIAGIVSMVEHGEIPEERVDASVLRILKLKQKYGILAPIAPTAEETENRAKAAAESVGSKAHHEQEWDITRQTVTLVKNAEELLPLDGSGKTVLLCPYDSELNTLEYAADRLRADGVIPKDAKIVCRSYENGDITQIEALLDGADTVAAVSALYSAAELDPAAEDGAGAKFLDAVMKQAQESGTHFVLISAQLPYDLARWTDADAALACYLAKGMAEKPGDFSGTTAAYGPNLAVTVCTLFGGNQPTGKLPVNIPVLDDKYQYTDEILYPRGTGLAYTRSAAAENTDEE